MVIMQNPFEISLLSQNRSGGFYTDICMFAYILIYLHLIFTPHTYTIKDIVFVHQQQFKIV